jgi:hypothetical protein
MKRRRDERWLQWLGALALLFVTMPLPPPAVSAVGLPPGVFPWPALHHNSMRTGQSAVVGPDDPTVLGPP